MVGHDEPKSIANVIRYLEDGDSGQTDLSGSLLKLDNAEINVKVQKKCSEECRWSLMEE